MTSRLIAAAGALALLTGCSIEGRFPALNSTDVVLTSNNYKVVMTGLKGEDSGFAVFGIGADAKIGVALEKIRVQAQLEDRSRALVNVSVDESWWTTGIVGGHHVMVTADVVEFTGPPTSSD